MNMSLAMCCSSASLVQSESFTQRLDIQTRVDERSTCDVRYDAIEDRTRLLAGLSWSWR
jgi:hypothetical protein